MRDTNTSFYNLVEPPAFVQLFTEFPPLSFNCVLDDATGMPLFATHFDILTTLDKDVRVRLEKLPLFRYWSRLFCFSTCFGGTTITEYAPIPKGQQADTLLASLLTCHAASQSLFILKDLPLASPLVSKNDNAFSQAIADAAGKQGFIEVEGQALAYVPIDFSSEDEYLSRLSAARRKGLRRKFKKRDALSIEALPLGDARFFEPALLDTFYEMYLAVFQQSDIHFDLLSKEYLITLLQSTSIEGVVFCYWHEGALVSYNICLVHQGMLIDKYIGFVYPVARQLNLYFISWMVNLNYAREQGLHTYIAGWTDPEVKASLGAQFTFTRHLVWVRNPVLRRILYHLRHLFESDSRAIGASS